MKKMREVPNLENHEVRSRVLVDRGPAQLETTANLRKRVGMITFLRHFFRDKLVADTDGNVCPLHRILFRRMECRCFFCW